MGMQSAAAAAKFSYLSPFISLTLSGVLTLPPCCSSVIIHRFDGLHNPHPAHCHSTDLTNLIIINLT